MKDIMRTLLAGLASALLLSLVASPTASAAPTNDTALRAALTRVGDGTYSTADLTLLKSDPEIAAQVADPTAAAENGANGGYDPAMATIMTASLTNAQAKAAGTCGYWYQAWYRKKSLLGFTMYRYYHRVDYCKTSTRITRWQARSDFWRDVNATSYWRERTDNRNSGIGSGTASSVMQRHIEECVVKYGCYQNFYPHVQLNVRASGSNTYSGSAG